MNENEGNYVPFGAKIYTLAYRFSQSTDLERYTQAIKIKCQNLGISGKDSKMGTHLTVLPPFYATEAEAKRYAAIAKLAIGLFEETRKKIVINGIGWFEAIEKDEKSMDALHLVVKLPKGYTDSVERLKSSTLFKWVHKPAQGKAVDPLYSPHIHIIEGEGVKALTEPHKKYFDLLVGGRSFALGPLNLFEKIEPSEAPFWKQVLV